MSDDPWSREWAEGGVEIPIQPLEYVLWGDAVMGVAIALVLGVGLGALGMWWWL